MARSALPRAKNARVEADDPGGDGSSAAEEASSKDEKAESSELGSDADSLDRGHAPKRLKLAADANSHVQRNSIFHAPSRIKRAQSRAQDGPAADRGNGANGPGAEAKPSHVLAPMDSKTSFDALGVRPWLVRALASMAIRRPTGIQKGCIPEILGGRDCIGGSRTGSGKTVAFLVPILQRLMENPSAVFAVILTPTRELALQILEQFKAIGSSRTLKAILVTGGQDMVAQAIALGQRPHIVIATPGRLADLIRTSGEDTICGLRRVRFLVLDEADRLLASSSAGSMLPDVEECLGVLPPPAERQTLLFTATVTPEVRALKSMPRRPGQQAVFVCEVDTERLAIPATLNQMHLQVPVTHKEHYLHMFLLTEANVDKSVIIFVNRSSTAEFLHHLLFLLEHKVTALYSKLSQRDRTNNLGRFRASAARILVATDVAARGLDIPEVSVVVNYDVPRDPDDYIHRVGRTARAGRKGDAVTFIGQRDVDLILAIEQRVGRPLEAWSEEGVNLETRVVRDALKLVGEKKREALLDIEERREVGGKRKKGKLRLRAAA